MTLPSPITVDDLFQQWQVYGERLKVFNGLFFREEKEVLLNFFKEKQFQFQCLLSVWFDG